MRNFIIFFHEKTGTSPLVRQLNKFELITVVHQERDTGFEPFDTHNCGRMSLKNLKKCLDVIFNQGKKNNEHLNRIYTTTAKRPLDVISDKGAIGFKMRFSPPSRYPLHIDRLSIWNKLANKLLRDYYSWSFKKMMFRTLKKHDVVVLMAVRQDLLRLGLSKYHGDGTGKPGHLQFKLARGVVAKNENEKIQVDCERLEKIVSKCKTLHENNRHLMEELKNSGIETHPILYEEFVADRRSYLERLFRILELNITKDEMSKVLDQEEFLKKVHSNDISEFVENHEEVTHRFADRFVSWS